MKRKLYIFLFLLLMILAPTTIRAYEIIRESNLSNGFDVSDYLLNVEMLHTSDKGSLFYGVTASEKYNINLVKYNNDKELEWKTSYGGSASDQFFDVIETSEGTYVGVGNTYSKDITNMTISTLNEAAIIVKFDSDGNMIWQKYLQGYNRGCYTKIVEVNDGGYIVLGNVSEDLKSYGIIVKYDTNGNIQWKQKYRLNSSGAFTDVIQNSTKEYIVVGKKYKDKNEIDAVILKYSSEGELLWDKIYGGSADDYFENIIETQNSEYIAVGMSDSTDIPEITPKGKKDIILVKYDKSGEIIWQTNYGGSEDEDLMELQQTLDKSVLLEIESYSTDIKDLNIESNYNTIFLKYDDNGQLKWQNSYSKDVGEAISTITADGGYIVSVTNLSFEVDDESEKLTDVNTYIYKYDKNGNLTWSETYDKEYGYIFEYIAEKSIGKYEFYGVIMYPGDLSNPIYNYATLELSVKYEFTTEETANGKYKVEQAGNTGIITLLPDKGYALDKLEVKDTEGTEVETYEEDELYYFDLYDDVSVNVTFKEEVKNPNTSMYLGIIILLPLAILLIVFTVIKKPKVYTN